MTNDVSAYTKAAVFQPGIRTDTLIRYGDRGRPGGTRVIAHAARLGAGRFDPWRKMDT